MPQKLIYNILELANYHQIKYSFFNPIINILIFLNLQPNEENNVSIMKGHMIFYCLKLFCFCSLAQRETWRLYDFELEYTGFE